MVGKELRVRSEPVGQHRQPGQPPRQPGARGEKVMRVLRGDGAGRVGGDELLAHGLGERQRGITVLLRVEVLAPEVALGGRLAMVAGAGTSPRIQTVCKVFRPRAEPGLIDHAVAQYVLPEQHAQAVVAQRVGLGGVGQAAAQLLEDILALALEGFGELAEIVQ